MSEELKRALDRELRKDRIRRSRLWILLGAGIILVLVILTPVLSERVYGVATEIEQTNRSDISKTRLKVRLDSGEVITVMADNNLPHARGQKVEILTMKSVAGMKTYEFVQYVASE